MECTVHWNGPGSMSFHAATGSGHWVSMDGSPEAGGRNLAPRPMEMMLVGAGGCSAFDVVLILQRGRHAVTGCDVKLQGERATTDPKVFTAIHLHFRVLGKAVPADAVERAVKLSTEKYCSALAMLGHTAQLTTSWEVQEAV
ncbi:OsmC family protein [Inhella gelatinilytica]|uniref:OsmC family protein n=1 Tax=Inhella gelatinilytica TaxID=2795030 RepID=A0A931IUY3_9BURK|nr:OsmC family protein [Inhella gelatinilytica]MBH9552417.1 OsmC family protein [Inhella gelatinilytica]